MHENSPPLSVSEIENLVTTAENEVSPDEQLSVESIIASPIVDFSGEAEICPEAASCSGGNGGDLDNQAYEQSCLASVFSDYFPPMDPSIFSPLIEAQPAHCNSQSAERLVEYSSTPMTVDAVQYSPAASMAQLLELPPSSVFNAAAAAVQYSTPPLLPLTLPPPPLPHCHPQQSLMQSFVGDERFLNMEAGVSGLYPSGGACGIMPMELMAGMQYQNMAAALFDLQNVTLPQHLCGSNDHAQLLMDTQVEKQQNNSSLVAVCSGSSSAPPRLPDISPLDESTFKIGCLTPEEKKEKIHRFMRKRNERNFTKKIKVHSQHHEISAFIYFTFISIANISLLNPILWPLQYACRKTLADSRPRVRGRFAKNEELGEATRIHMESHDYDDGDEVKDEEAYDSSDILAHITGVNSFKHGSSTEPWTI
ncbi:hypothetical protein KSP40_PGU017235 [Platanthera guangdongensis]|uniref:CCT domain-containing protein n=1 Tax=Platanthera guangdongensis TaxID=2320717 RepID=A0ABR2MA69_9ASPA